MCIRESILGIFNLKFKFFFMFWTHYSEFVKIEKLSLLHSIFSHYVLKKKLILKMHLLQSYDFYL